MAFSLNHCYDTPTIALHPTKERTMGKTAYNPDTMNKPFGIFANATLAGPGRLYFISGQVAVDAQGNLIGKGDIRAQTRQVLENIKAALAAVHATMDDVACVNVFVMDMHHLQAIHEVRAEYWQSNYPASTLVQVAGLVHPDYLIEINALAIVP
jgi:2-iminobutanoate/2-iminopropanoate deaminase